MVKQKPLIRKLGAVLRGVLCWPIVGILAVCGIRFAFVSNPGRIGHLAAEVDCFLKERALGLVPDEHPILLLDRRRAGNIALLDIYKRHLTVLDRRWQRHLLAEITKIQTARLSLGRPVVGFSEAARYSQVLALWGDRPPVVTLPDDIEQRGRTRLQELGVPADAWFVCVHAREGGYSPIDENAHAHRNAQISTYGPAMTSITDRGGWVVRVGDPTMTPLEPMDQVVDYALSPLKADWMDLWLTAHNRFFVGTSSGLAMLANVFGTPCALVNMIPLGASYGMAPSDISIPKRLLDEHGRVLSLSEVFKRGLSVQRYAHMFAENNVVIVDNSPQEVKALVDEMLERVTGAFKLTDDDEVLQWRYRKHLTPLDYSYGSMARIGRDWLRENRELL
ncbi:MAG: TIGR04372 family glycosyltransferase [Pseudomonadota bacterium]